MSLHANPTVEPEPTKGERRNVTAGRTLTTPLVDNTGPTSHGLNPPTKRRKLTTSAEVDNGAYAKDDTDIEDRPPINIFPGSLGISSPGARPINAAAACADIPDVDRLDIFVLILTPM